MEYLVNFPLCILGFLLWKGNGGRPDHEQELTAGALLRFRGKLPWSEYQKMLHWRAMARRTNFKRKKKVWMFYQVQHYWDPDTEPYFIVDLSAL